LAVGHDLARAITTASEELLAFIEHLEGADANSVDA